MSLILSACFLLASSYAFAEKKPVSVDTQLASILLNFEFYLASNERRYLQKISKDKSITENQRTLVKSLINVQHKALYSDLPKLEKVMNDDKASVVEQEIAYILHRMRFKPSKADKILLRKIVLNK